VGAPDDRYEREADQVSAMVMRMPEPAGGGQRPAAIPAAPVFADGIRALHGAGKPLQASDRSFFEARFGFDFSGVRVHDGPVAAYTARALGAQAYTIGHDVVFGGGQYMPGTNSGRHLLAHELTHVVQQTQGRPAAIQRRLAVENPGTVLPGAPPRQHWEDIRDYIARLSSGFQVASTGDVTPTSAATCTAPVRVSDRCLCDLHNSANDWKIKIDDLDWPHTEEANHRVTVHSTRSPVSFGAWGGGAQAGQRIEQDMSRVLGHELCGHAWLMERGIHPTGPAPTIVGGRPMGRQSHDPTVAIENQVAGEITPGAPQRGQFADPHHGESFARVTVSGYATGNTDPAALSPDMLARLMRVKDMLLADPLLRADIVGHTDPSGSAGANAAVSLARAQHVRNHLHGLGVPLRSFLAVVGRGATECPPVPQDNPACRKTDIFLFIFQGASLRNP
jgi:outer membrane protein OmpA-like peptidoglycan-associated protein